MAKQSNPDQFDLFDDWLVVGAQPIIPPILNSEATLAQSFDEPRHILALRLSQKLNAEGEITTQFLTEAANQAFGGTQAQGTYSTKDAYDALEAAFNIHLLSTEDSGWTEQGAEWARTKAIDLTSRIQKLPTQTKRDEEMDEFQQFSTPPALSFVANWVANVNRDDVMVEPSAGTGDLAVWPEIAGAVVILNELAPRRQALLSALFPKARLFKENAEQLDNVLPTDIAPTVIVMNPPFSSTAGRVHGQRDTTNGARHIEQALKRLEDNGRLVAIVGNGMAADRPAFYKWWKDIEKKYNVRANVGISGKEYAKYGTSFDNQILVIDKTGATTQPVLTGKVESVADLPTLLEGIRNDRQQIQSNITKPAVKADTRSESDSVQPGNGIGGVSIGKDGVGTQSIGNRADSGAITVDSQTGGETTVGDGGNDGIGAGDGIRVNPIGDVGGSGGGDTGGNSGVPKSDSPRGVIVRNKAEEDHLFDVLLTTLVVDKKAASTFSQTTGVIIGTANQTDQALKQWRKEQRKLKPEQRIDVLGFIPDDLKRLHKVGRYAENPDSQTSSSHQDGQTVTPPIAVEVKNGNIPEEFTDSVFANYTPQRLTIQGAQQHPGKLVQSAAMSAVEPPAPSYAPVLPTNLIKDGLLSIAQLEAVVYAGQAHSELLPNGSRKGFFIGDGTGVGKGREISGIILDNMMQGRNKAVWISFNEGLIEDAKRDFAGIGGDPGKIFFQGKTKAGNEITQEDGILFTTYSTLRGGEKKQANDLGQEGGKTRAQQIINWLGEDFDGVIAFDEAHSMGNAIAVKGKRGVRKPSQQAIAGINLQRELPNARITYVSATGATEVSNLSYADRLGLWGEGTPFADVNTFIAGVTKGGIASMELISRDMKAMGMYLARSLSYDGVSYERLEHTLSDFQEDIYNELAGSWQIVLNNVEQALEITQAGSSGNAKSAAMAQFWGAHQRFFNQIITAMQTPRVIDDIREQLDAGNVAVIQLVNTNEAAQERIIADATAHNTALEDLDFTPRQMLMDYVRNGFPVAAYEESKDDNGNTIYVPVRDSEGNPVFDREAIALRDALLETLQQIRVPENPLDSIINAFGSDRVAEITGRSRRFVQTRDDDGNYKVVEEKRGKNSARADAEAFQANKKDILVFSGAGGTGYSFHADNTADNQRKRIHYILQPGWRADAAVQGFGRTHRTNQANAPHYVLPTTNLKAQKRFVSSIARRLDQLGALTRGQREATSQGMFTAADNLESHYAAIALNNFFTDLYRGKTDLSFHDVTKQMGLNLLDENGALSESKMPGIPQFLNRLLSLKTDRQNEVFAEFENRLVEAVEYAKQQGLYDVGLQTLTAASIKKTRENVIYEDKQTGAQTRYVELAVTTDVSYYDWNNDVTKLTQRRQNVDDLSGWFVSELGKNKGEVFFMSDLGGRLDSEGNAVRRGVIHTIKKNGHRYIDNADVISRGWDYRTVTANGVGSYQKVTLTRPIDKVEAEKLWHEQVANAPKTETRIGRRMIVGVILPIWDRVEGSETIKRLQTDEGEQLLGRMLGSKSAKQTLKNLGLDSGLANLSASDLFKSIKDGNKAVLSNGWIIATARVNHESRIEIKGRSSFTDAERRVLKDQGAFIERINWAERVFIPSGDQGLDVFKRITESKPVIDLLGLRNPIKQETDNEINKTTEPAETTGSDQSIFNTGGTNAPETGRERDLFPTSRLSDEKPTRGQYATETELISESRRLLTVGRIITVDQAAQAALSVSVQAVERFDALVTDKDGKPLAIVGSFKGTINSASVYPAVVAAEAFRIPDAANIYFYHNHPSGTTKLSDADLAITRKLQRVFDGSGITAHGIFAITTNGSFSYENPATREVVDGVAQSGAAAVSVPIIERIISFDEKMGAGVTSPDISKSLIPKLFNESGLMLLNNQHEPVGFMPMSPGEALPLKHTGMTDNLFRALSMSNAAAAILYDSEHHYSVEQYQNIGEFLDEIDIRLLDVVVKQENPNSSGASVMISGAELGWSFRSSTGVFLNDIPSISWVEKSNTKKVSQMSSRSKDKKAFHEMVADKLIQQLKEGTAPWQRPWVPGESGAFLPYNPVTGNRYKGINSIYLLSQERDDQRWMTYKQATGLGGQVRKGEKGTGIQYWKFTEEHIKKDDDGKPILDSEGNPVKEVVRLERPRGFFAIVFNGEQIDGLLPIQKQEHTWDPIERAEWIITASGADIHHNGGSRAFYRPLTDSIHLPDKGQFPSAENYYATALHELGHWSGHKDRLNRDLVHPFGSEGYAKEELRAEIASMILGDELGIGHDPSQHAAYVGSWIKALKDDPMEIFRAAADAEKIQNYVIGLEQKQVQEQTAGLVDKPRYEVRNVGFEDDSVISGHIVKTPIAIGIYENMEDGTQQHIEDYHLAANNEVDLCVNRLNNGEIDLSEAKDILVRYEFTDEQFTKATMDAKHAQDQAARQNQEQGQPIVDAYDNKVEAIKAYKLTSDEFNKIAVAAPLVNHGRKWEVFVGEQSYGFSDGETAGEAINEVHKHDVNNALYSLSTENTGAVDVRTMPPLRVLNEYPDLVEKFAGSIDFSLVQEQSVHPEANVHPQENAQGIPMQSMPGKIMIYNDRPGSRGVEVWDEYGSHVGFGGKVAIARYAQENGLSPEDVQILNELDSQKYSSPAPDVGLNTQEVPMQSMPGKTMIYNDQPGRRGVEVWDEYGSHVGFGGKVAIARFAQENKLSPEDVQILNELDSQKYSSPAPDVGLNDFDRVDKQQQHTRSLEQEDKMQTNNYQADLARGNKEQVIYLVGSHSGSTEYTDVLDASQAFHDANVEQQPFVIRSGNRVGGVEASVTIASTSMVEHGGVKEYGKGVGDTDPAFKVAYDGILGQTQKPEKTYINVSFKEKEEAKALGAKWDRQEKSWYVSSGVNLAPFAKWEKPAVTAEKDELKVATFTESQVKSQKPAQERQYLAVPYGERAAAKASGAIWDKAAKSWYVGPDGDMAKLERWKPGNVPNQQGPAMQPEGEFAEALRSLGCVVDGQHPIMDGAKHRIVVEGDKSRERSGFYVGHLDGHPAGYIKNNRTGVDMKWKSKGYALDPEEKAQLQAEAAIKLREREVVLQAKQKDVAVDIIALLNISAPAPADHPYLQSKQVRPGDLRIVPPATTVLPDVSNIIIGKDWKESSALRESNPDKLVFTTGDLFVPAYDVNGTVWTAQTIQSSGRKMFAKDSRKEGCFHVIGGFDALAKAPAIVIGEGFATAGSLSETLGFPTVSAFDSGNLVLVAKALHEMFPDKPIVIAGDDDKHLESTHGYNPGRSKANEAAKAVGGKVLLPIFSTGEQAYPENLEPVTPTKARAGDLSDEQKEAIAKMKSFTDFNDLATKSVLGKEGIERQVRSVVFSVIDKHQARIEQQQERVQQQEQRPRRAAKIG